MAPPRLGGYLRRQENRALYSVMISDWHVGLSIASMDRLTNEKVSVSARLKPGNASKDHMIRDPREGGAKLLSGVDVGV